MLLEKIEINTSETLSFEKQSTIEEQNITIHDLSDPTLTPEQIFQKLLEKIKINENDHEENMEQLVKIQVELFRKKDLIGQAQRQICKEYEKKQKWARVQNFIRNNSSDKSDLQQENNKEQQMLIWKNSIGYLIVMQESSSLMLQKVLRWRELRRQKTKKLIQLNLSINRNLYKKYNLTNYLEQLTLVRQMLNRINQRCSLKLQDYTYLEHQSQKSLIPYSFYSKYIMKCCVNAFLFRLHHKQLTNFKRVHHFESILRNILQRVISFKKRLPQKCQGILLLLQNTCFSNVQGISLQCNILTLYAPLVLQKLLQHADKISSQDFLKASSIMQYSDETIDLWQQFIEIKFQQYFLYYHHAMHFIRRNQMLKYSDLKDKLQFYQQKFQWIISIQKHHSIFQRFISKNQQNNIISVLDFKNDFLRDLVIKIIRPFILCLQRNNQPDKQEMKERNKEMKSDEECFKKYLLYCVFHSHKLISKWLFGSDNKMDNKDLAYKATVSNNMKQEKTLSSKDFITKIFSSKSHNHVKDNSFEDQLSIFKQFNIDQLYLYYKHNVALLLQEYLSSQISQEFQYLWKQLVSQYCFHYHIISPHTNTLTHSIIQHQKQIEQEVKQDFNKSIEILESLRSSENKLIHLLAYPKKKKNQNQKEEIYKLLLKLHLTSKKYFLIKEAYKCLGNDVKKQILTLRSLIFQSFYS